MLQCSYSLTERGGLARCEVSTRQVQKGNTMEDEMNVGELLKQTAEENQTRKILEILTQCQTLEEALEKVRALLKK